MRVGHYNLMCFTSTTRREGGAETASTEVTANGSPLLVVEPGWRMGLKRAAANAMGDNQR